MDANQTTRAAQAGVKAAQARLAAAQQDLQAAERALADAAAAEVATRFRRIEWEVLYELGIGGVLVRYDDPSDANNNDRNLPRRFREKPGCLVSGEFDRRTPVSDRTMRSLVRSGLAHWVHEPGSPVEMKLTPAGMRRIQGMARPSRK
jgi:hypothetical protein